MAEFPQGHGVRRESMTKELQTGKEKLEQLKARLFPPETQAQRTARALEAL
jgi:hypothetical protein